MSQKDIQNLLILGATGFAIYYFFLRKVAPPVGGPLALPELITVTPQIVGTGIQFPGQVVITPSVASQRAAQAAQQAQQAADQQSIYDAAYGI